MDNEELKIRLDILERKIDLILELLKKEIEPHCEKMSSHIDFIDKVYETVKHPLNYICSKVNNKAIEI